MYNYEYGPAGIEPMTSESLDNEGCSGMKNEWMNKIHRQQSILDEKWAKTLMSFLDRIN